MWLVLFLFIFFVGGGWLIGKAIGGTIFGSDEKEYDDGLTGLQLLKRDGVNIDEPEVIKRPKLILQQAINKIIVVHQKDDFDDTELIYFNHVTQPNRQYLPMYFEKIGSDFVSHEHIGLSFSIFERNVYLDVTSYSISEMGLAKGDELILIFDNGERMNIVFNQTRSGGSGIKSNSYILNALELKMFSIISLNKWKLISSRRNVYIIGDNTIFYDTCEINDKKTSQEILKYLATTITKKFIEKFSSKELQ